MRRSRWLLAGAVIVLVPSAAQAQWQNGDMALRTNGNLFESGERLKVELLALAPIPEQFSPEIRYVFVEQVKVVGEGGISRDEEREKTVTRPLGVAVERMELYQRVVLDDTLRMGMG